VSSQSTEGHGSATEKRREYLKFKARERRKREREEADKQGVTVKALREQKTNQ
jgi:hypothetical protein